MVSGAAQAGPWRFARAWATLTAGPATFTLTPDPDERRAIAAALGAEAVAELTARITVRPWLDGVALDGRVQAVVTRLCGLSLDPFDEPVDDTFSIQLVPAGALDLTDAGGAEIVVDLDAPDPPEPVEGDQVDLGHYAFEALSLALDPFPRKPGAAFEAPPPQPVESPFDVLAALRVPRSEP